MGFDNYFELIKSFVDGDDLAASAYAKASADKKNAKGAKE